MISSNSPEPYDAAAQPLDIVAPASEDDRDRAYQRHAKVVELGRRTVAPDVHLLVQDSAALLAESLSAERLGIAELNEDRTKLEMRLATVAGPGTTAPGVVRPDPSSVRQLSLDPSRSLAAYTMQLGETVVVEDLATERRFADIWLSERSVRGAVAVPLRFFDEAYGMLAVLCNRPRQFARDDLLFAEMIANFVSTNLAHHRTNKTLELERRFAAKVLETVDALVLVLAPSGRIIRANSACEQITGYVSEEVRDRTIWTALLVPGEADAVKGIFARLQNDPGPLVHEGYILTKHAERRRIAWSFGLLAQLDGDVETILATGIDVTERRLAEEEVGRLKTAEAESQSRLQAVLEELESQKAAANRRAVAAAKGAESEDFGWQTDSNPFHPLQRDSRGDRRRRPRRSFTYYQRIAPMENGRMPPLRMFRRVRCLDISAGGFSFLSTVRPTDTDYVVALGNPSMVINVAARIVHITPMEHEGRSTYLVGCKYTGRLDY